MTAMNYPINSLAWTDVDHDDRSEEGEPEPRTAHILLHPVGVRVLRSVLLGLHDAGLAVRVDKDEQAPPRLP